MPQPDNARPLQRAAIAPVQLHCLNAWRAATVRLLIAKRS